VLGLKRSLGAPLTTMTLLAAQLRTRLVWRNRETGQALVEYSLILCLVVVIVIVTLILLGNSVKNTYCNIASAVGA
jgi:Flp pilus assembly pilin Flp